MYNIVYIGIFKLHLLQSDLLQETLMLVIFAIFKNILCIFMAPQKNCNFFPSNLKVHENKNLIIDREIFIFMKDLNFNEMDPISCLVYHLNITVNSCTLLEVYSILLK